MYSRPVRRAFVGLAVLALGITFTPAHATHGSGPHSGGTGPTTTVSPYVLPLSEAVHIRSMFTVDDQPAGNGVDMVGIPDGLGAFKQGGDMVVYMNHEFTPTAGAVHAHGQRGAFVSRNVINRHTGAVESTTDLITTVRFWDYTTGTYSATATGGASQAFARFCSGSLTDPGALASGENGYAGQMYFANEENGDNGRAFGVTDDGVATQLPRLGLFAWENTLLADTRNDQTVVLGNEDGANGQLRIYVGTKQRAGSPAERAGLTNGTLHVLDISDQAVTTDAQYRSTFGTGTPVAAQANVVNWNANGAAQNIEAAAQGLTLNRIEDGAFDPRHPNDYYFVTTEGGDTTSVENNPVTGNPVTRDGGGVWRLRFADVSDPTSGMTLTLLLDGSEAPYLNKPDNMDIDEAGHLLIQEDSGNNAHLTRILALDLASGQIAELAQFDPDRFAPGATGYPRTIDEESSGIIDVAGLLGKGAFLFDAQVHTGAGLSDPARQVEHGQLLSMEVDWREVFD